MVSMRRALLLVAAVVLLPMAAACGGSKSTERQSEEPSQATATTEAAVEEGEGGAAPGPQEFSPLGLLTGDLPGLGGGPAGLKVNQDVDPSLAAALLRKEDLPGAFGSLAGGQFSFSVPSEDGDVNMAMSLFFSGDPAAGAEGPAAAVISAAAAMPPDLLKKSLASFPSGQGSEDEIRAALSRAEKISGLKFLDVGILDASGLGEEAAGLHVVMDFGRVLGGQTGFTGGAMAFDMYMFSRSDRMLMVIVMWSNDQSRPLDGKALADIMDGRAKEAF